MDEPEVAHPHRDHHSAFRGQGVPTHATTREDLLEAITENIVLSAISESPKDKHPLILFIGGTWTSQIHRDRKQGMGEEEMGSSYVLGRSLSFARWESSGGGWR